MIHSHVLFSLLISWHLVGTAFSQTEPSPPDSKTETPFYGTITEETPSIPEYFSWINNTNEGSTEAQTLTNLEFFKWLHDEYGMQLGIYAWDAGNIDSAQYYGNMESDKFKSQFPNGWGGISDLAKSFDCRLGLWGGPDGFGDTPEEEQARIDLLASLCRDYGLQLFKFDAVCTQLRDEKQDAFARAMMECRKYAPDLIVLNHRLNLGHAKPHATTFLWGGQETYIDVHMRNRTTATHNRAGALARGLPPELKRLTEDHGVCISSCLDYWEDDLILQAFNRNLILAPQIYGNPWLLRDDEFAKLSRIFNLHFRNRDILVKGMVLPEEYGPHAVARGDASTRFLSLRNLTWEPVIYDISLNEEIGLTAEGPVEVRRYHPSENILGTFDHGKTIQVEVAPFRSYLLMATTRPSEEIAITGCEYEVVRDTTDKPVLLKLLGQPGSTATISLKPGTRTFSKALLGGKEVPELLTESTTLSFPGESSTLPWHRKLADLKPVAVPSDAEQLYESTCFSAENNALEVQSLHRSGASQIPAVKKARDAFFEQDLFWQRGVWDKYMFDDNPETFFSVLHYGRDKRIDGGALRIDLSDSQAVDQIVIQALYPTEPSEPLPTALTAEISHDLVTWKTVTLTKGAEAGDTIKVANITKNGGEHTFFETQTHSWNLKLESPETLRYLRIHSAPERVSEFQLLSGDKTLDRSQWRATHLFAPFSAAKPIAAWQAEISLEKNVPKGSYLCVALEGEHGPNKAFAALRMGKNWVGASQRAPSFPCVAWEYPARSMPRNDTYFFPVTDEMRGQKIEVVVLGLTGGKTEFQPHVWITANQTPLEPVILELN